MAIDGNDAAHICYRSYSDNALMYKTNAGGSWTTSAVDLLGSSTAHASIAVSEDGIAHLCYIASDGDGDHLKYARIGGVQGPEASAPVNVPGYDAEPALEDPPLTGQPALTMGAIGLVAALSVVVVLLLRRRAAA